MNNKSTEHYANNAITSQTKSGLNPPHMREALDQCPAGRKLNNTQRHRQQVGGGLLTLVCFHNCVIILSQTPRLTPRRSVTRTHTSAASFRRPFFCCSNEKDFLKLGKQSWTTAQPEECPAISFVRFSFTLVHVGGELIKSVPLFKVRATAGKERKKLNKKKKTKNRYKVLHGCQQKELTSSKL